MYQFHLYAVMKERSHSMFWDGNISVKWVINIYWWVVWKMQCIIVSASAWQDSTSPFAVDRFPATISFSLCFQELSDKERLVNISWSYTEWVALPAIFEFWVVWLFWLLGPTVIFWIFSAEPNFDFLWLEALNGNNNFLFWSVLDSTDVYMTKGAELLNYAP